MVEPQQIPHIYSVGVSYNDYRVDVTPKLQELIDRYGLRPDGPGNGKYSVGNGAGEIDEKTFYSILEPVRAISPSTHGGSGGNIFCTIQRLLGENVNTTYQTVIDADSENVIGKSFKAAGVNVISSASSDRLESGSSIVMRLPNAKRIIVSHDGNARIVLAKEFLNEKHVDKVEITFLEGSLWQKLGFDSPNKVMAWRWDKTKELWLSLPTKADFARPNAEHFRYIIPSTNIVVGNLDELGFIYNTQGKDALNSLQAQFGQTVLTNPRREPTGFITDGENGFYYVTKDGWKIVTGTPNAQLKIVNRLGAGDTALAGALTAALMGLPNHKCCQIGNFLAEDKICDNNGAQVLNPMKALENRCQDLFAELVSAVQSKRPNSPAIQPAQRLVYA